MAKKVYKLNNYEGGINRSADPRDIQENELEEAFNVNISKKGRITMPGNGLYSWYTHNDHNYKYHLDSNNNSYGVLRKMFISDRDILTNGVGLTNGYGLFSCAHDYTSNGMMSEDGTGTYSNPQPEESEFILINDGADIHLWDSSYNDNGAKGQSRWAYKAIQLGGVHLANSQSNSLDSAEFKDKVKPTYYKSDNGIRVCDGNFNEIEVGTLHSSALVATDDSLQLNENVFTSSDVGMYFKVNSEIVEVESFTQADTVAVKRGRFNTAIMQHSSGDSVYRINVPKILEHINRTMLEHSTCYDTNNTDITYTNTTINTWKENIQCLEKPERTVKLDSGNYGRGLIVYDGKVTAMGRFVDTGTPKEEPATFEKVLLSIHESNTADNNEIEGASYASGSGLNGQDTITLTAVSGVDLPSNGFVPGKTIIVTGSEDAGVNGIHDIVAAGSADNIIEVTGALAGSDDTNSYIIRLEEDRIDENLQNQYVFGMSYLYEGGGGEMQESPIQMGYMHRPLIPHNDSIIRTTASAANETGWQRQDTEGGSYEDINDTDSKWIHDNNSLLWNSHASLSYEYIAYKGSSDLTAGGSYKLALDVTISGATSSSDVLRIHPPGKDADSDGGTVGGVDEAIIASSGTYLFDIVVEDNTPAADLDKWFLAEVSDTDAVIRINSVQLFETDPVEMSGRNAIDMRSFDGIPKMFSSFNMNTHNNYSWNERISGYKIYMKQVDSATTQLADEWNLLLETNFKTGKFINYANDSVEKVLNLSNDWSVSGSSAKNSLVATSINLGGGGYSVRGISDYDGMRHIPLETYESENGYKADTTLSAMYKTSTMINGKMFIGNLKIGDRTYPDRMIESPVFRPDTFPDDGRHYIDVAVSDGDAIVKIESVGDKLIQFKEHHAYVLDVDSEGLDLINTWNGKGVKNPSQVVKAGDGVVWANNNGLYYYDGNQMIDVTLNKFDMDEWKINENAALPAILAYDEASNKVIIQTTNKFSSRNGGYIYDLNTKSIVEAENLFIWYGQQEDIDVPGILDVTPELLKYNPNDDSVVHPDNDTVALLNTFRSNIITTRNKFCCVATNTLENPLRVEFNRWDDDPKFLWQYTDAASKFNLQTKDIDFGNPSRRKKVYKVYVTFKSYGYVSGVRVKYAINGSNSFTGTFKDTTYYTNAKGFDSWNASVANTTSGAITTDNSTQDWITVALKPSSSINNVYSMQLKFEHVNAGHSGYAVSAAGGVVGSSIGTDSSVAYYNALSAYLTTSSGVANTSTADYYAGMPFFVYWGQGNSPDFRVIDYDESTKKVLLDCPTHPKLLNANYTTIANNSYYDLGHIPSHFEINDISIVYREKSIK